MKKIVIGLVVLVVAFVGGIAFILSNLDEYVKEAVEGVGSEVTKVAVTLGGADIDPANGRASLTGLKVGNPAGFETDYAMSLGGISVKMDPTTVTSDVIVINEISIDAPAIIYELGGSGSNIDKIQSNVEAYVNALTGGSSSADASADEASSSESDSPKLIIEHVYIRNTEASISAAILGGKKMTVPVPDLHLTDIGKDDGGASPAEAATLILDELLNDVTSAVGSVDLSGVADIAKDVLSGSGDIAKEGEEVIEGAVEEAGNLLGNILGGSN